MLVNKLYRRYYENIEICYSIYSKFSGTCLLNQFLNIGLGKIIGEVVEDEQTHLGISIMSDQRPNTVEVNIYLNGKKDYRYRHIFFYLDIESYNNLFNSELSVSGDMKWIVIFN